MFDVYFNGELVNSQATIDVVGREKRVARDGEPLPHGKLTYIEMVWLTKALRKRGGHIRTEFKPLYT